MERGADVAGIDVSARVLALARQRLGNDVALHQVDLHDRLPFEDGFRDLSTKPCFLFFVVEVPPSEFDKATKLLGSFHSGIRHA